MAKKRADRDLFKDTREKSSDVNTNFSVIEAYRTIRTNFLFSVSKKDNCKKVVFSSSMPRDGKTTTCVNLAISLSQTDVKILLIDCDLRKPRSHKFFNLPNVPGLTNILGGFNSISESIAETQYRGLHFLPSGIIPPNPAELISGKHMENLMEELEKHYDYILLDSPPLGIVSDAMLLAKICDGIILVARQNITSHPDLTRVIKNLEFAEADILGIILNQVEVSKRYGYGRYGKQYKNGKYRYDYSYSD